MGAITGTQILERAWAKAQDDGDTGPIRWKSPEALRCLNDGLRELVVMVPSAYTLSAVRPLVAGSNRQTLTGLGLTTGFQVMEVPYFYAADLTTPIRAMTLKERKHYDEMNPRWRSDLANEVSAFMMDASEPEVFYIHPRVQAGGVQVVYAALPPELATVGTAIPVSDIYANALQYFVLSSFYAKDTTFTAAPAKSAYYMQAMAQSVGVKRQNSLMSAAEAISKSNAKGAQ